MSSLNLLVWGYVGCVGWSSALLLCKKCLDILKYVVDQLGKLRIVEL